MPAKRQISPPNRPEGLQDFAYRQILRSILSGDLGPGDKLSPAKIAEALKISHIPVREALASLESSGHVVREPRVGVFVAPLSWDYIEDVYHWRQVLEDEAHRVAVPKLDESDFARMLKINQASSRTTNYSEKYLDLNRDFHFIVFERAGSATLLHFLNRLWDASLRYQNAMSSAPVKSSMLKDHHHALVEALKAHDADRANALMVEHRGVTLDAIRKLLTERADETA